MGLALESSSSLAERSAEGRHFPFMFNDVIDYAPYVGSHKKIDDMQFPVHPSKIQSHDTVFDFFRDPQLEYYFNVCDPEDDLQPFERLEEFRDWAGGPSQKDFDRALEESLNRWNPKIVWKKGFWDFIKEWNFEAKHKVREDNWPLFEGCYQPSGSGKVAIMENGEHRLGRHYCNERLCLLCENRKRRRLAFEKIEQLKPFFDRLDLPGMAFAVFTLPEELERESGFMKRFQDEIHKAFKKLYKAKSRSNFYFRAVVHPVGHSDLFRDRFHVHVSVIPAEIDLKTGDVQVLDLDHGAEIENANKLRKAWGKALKKFGYKVDMPVVRYEYFQYDGSEKGKEIFWRKVGHRMIYDSRSFAHDIEVGLLRTNEEGDVILKAQRGNTFFWRLVHVSELIERFDWIKEHNRFTIRGWGRRLGVLSEVLEFGEEEEPEERIVAVVDAEVCIIRKKEWSKSLKRVVRTEQEIWTYRNPVTGRMIQLEKREIVKRNLEIRGVLCG